MPARCPFPLRKKASSRRTSSGGVIRGERNAAMASSSSAGFALRQARGRWLSCPRASQCCGPVHRQDGRRSAGRRAAGHAPKVDRSMRSLLLNSTPSRSSSARCWVPWSPFEGIYPMPFPALPMTRCPPGVKASLRRTAKLCGIADLATPGAINSYQRRRFRTHGANSWRI